MTKVRGLFIHPGQADEIASRHPLIGRYQIVVTRREDKDEMTFRIELKEAVPQTTKLKEEIEKSIRDVMKLRGDVDIVPGGTIPKDAKRIEDQRSWE
jgi:phenylacetate-CoA ligase